MGLGSKRERTLYGILSKAAGVHRYTVARWLVGIGCTVGIALLLVTDTMRFDFWSGRHRVLGREVGLVEAAKAFAFPFLALNIAIIVASRFLGRYLCGFVCPVGSLGRFAEWARFKDKKGKRRWLGPLTVLAACILLSVITFGFWVDLRVFREGSSFAVGVSSVLLGSLALGLFVTVQVVGLRFCRDWCPSGVYFALLGQETSNGIEFSAAECTDCGICDIVCPMDLKPRDMSGGTYRGSRGLYGEALSNFALCIRCGDCVVGCEEVGSNKSVTSALRMGLLPPDLRDSRPAEPKPLVEEHG